MAYMISPKEECTFCSNCFAACEFGAIVVDDFQYYRIDAEKCVECEECVQECPLALIQRNEETPRRKKLSRIAIDAEKCVGCSLCRRACPRRAISGVVKSAFTIDRERCMKCGVCAEKCRKGAFILEYEV